MGIYPIYLQFQGIFGTEWFLLPLLRTNGPRASPHRSISIGTCHENHCHAQPSGPSAQWGVAVSFGEDSQILIPEAFTAIHSDPVRGKLTISREELAQRFELCEDMANLLSDSSAAQWFKTGQEKEEFLEQVRQGLLGENSVVSEPEAQWVVGRIGEVLGW